MVQVPEFSFFFTLEYVSVNSEEDIIPKIVECANLSSNKLKIMGKERCKHLSNRITQLYCKIIQNYFKYVFCGVLASRFLFMQTNTAYF